MSDDKGTQGNKGTQANAGQRQLLTEQLTAVAEVHEARAKLARINLRMIDAGILTRGHEMSCW